MNGKLPYIISNFRPRNYTSGRKTDIFPKRVGSLCRLFDSSWISGCVCSLDVPNDMEFDLAMERVLNFEFATFGRKCDVGLGNFNS